MPWEGSSDGDVRIGVWGNAIGLIRQYQASIPPAEPVEVHCENCP
jgi:hypothetical protein